MRVTLRPGKGSCLQLSTKRPNHEWCQSEHNRFAKRLIGIWRTLLENATNCHVIMTLLTSLFDSVTPSRCRRAQGDPYSTAPVSKIRMVSTKYPFDRWFSSTPRCLLLGSLCNNQPILLIASKLYPTTCIPLPTTTMETSMGGSQSPIPTVCTCMPTKSYVSVSHQYPYQYCTATCNCAPVLCV